MAETPRLQAKQGLPDTARLVIPAEVTVSKLAKETHCTIRHSGLDPESSFFKAFHSWMPDQVRHDGDVDFNQPILESLFL